MALVDAPASTPRLLAFDTSTENLAIAVDDGVVAHCINAAGGALASQQLLPQVHALLRRARLGLAQIDGIAFGCGPGAFTGLRTACSVAQGLALGLKLPLLPIDSLLIVAEDARAQISAGADDTPFEVAVVMDARMSEIYCGRYRHVEGRWQTLLAPQLFGLDALVKMCGGGAPPVVAGSALTAFDLRPSLPAGTTTVDSESDRAAALLRLARLAHATGAAVDAAEALPLYLRDKVAQTTAERERAKAAPTAA